LPLALRRLQGLVNIGWGALMAGSAIATYPLIAIFMISARQLIASLTAGAIE